MLLFFQKYLNFKNGIIFFVSVCVCCKGAKRKRFNKFGRFIPDWNEIRIQKEKEREEFNKKLYTDWIDTKEFENDNSKNVRNCSFFVLLFAFYDNPGEI